MFQGWPVECLAIAERLRPMLCRHGADFYSVKVPNQVRVGWETGKKKNPWLATLKWKTDGSVEFYLRVSRNSRFFGKDSLLRRPHDKTDSAKDTAYYQLTSSFPKDLPQWIEEAFRHCAERYKLSQIPA